MDTGVILRDKNANQYMRDKHGFKSCQMLETEKETQMEYEIDFYFKKGIRLLSFQAED